MIKPCNSIEVAPTKLSIDIDIQYVFIERSRLQKIQENYM